MNKYCFLFLCAALFGCGAFDESPETLAIEANQGLVCDMSPEGKWAAYPEYVIGSCGYLAPLWAYVDADGSLYMEEEANCETVKEMVVDRGPNNPCQKVTMFSCTNEEMNLKAQLHFFLQNRSEEFTQRIQWEGNLNIKVGYLDEEDYLCDSVYNLRVIYHPQEE